MKRGVNDHAKPNAPPGETPTIPGTLPTPRPKHGPKPGPTPDHCRRCRYPLVGLAEDDPCPECGSRIRQVGPHAIIENNTVAAGMCICIGGVMLFAVCAGGWPAIFVVPVVGLIAVIFGEREARSRRRRDLPMSRATLIFSILGWLMFLPAVVLLITLLLIRLIP